MDLFTAARSLSRPFEFAAGERGGELGIGARGLIGDGFSCALVRVDGAIDWLCLPRFDSPSVFGALLDPERGGLTAITPASCAFESLQRYDPDTNVLETLFRVHDRGQVRLTDYMPWSDDPRATIHEIHRRIECRDGEVELELVFDPRFGYGLESTRIEATEHGLLATGPSGERLVAAVGGSVEWKPRPGGGRVGTIRLRSGERRWMVLSWDTPRPEPIEAYRPFEHLRATRHAWREWSRQLRYDGPWRHHVMRAALALKLLIYARTGAVVAAPTTSLPEWVGGVRNWDYRYTWTRDAALTIRAANLIGFDREARDFFHFIRDTLDRIPELGVMYTVDGELVPRERSLDHLRGYRGSGPVRIGNGAKDQLQFDTAGTLVDAAFMYERFGGSLPLRAWRHIEAIIGSVEQRWQEPDHGIWEPRAGISHNVHSKLMSWVALDRGHRLAPLFGAPRHAQRWKDAAEAVRADLLSNGLDRSGKRFVGRYGSDVPDASLLRLPTQGFLPASDPRVSETIRWLRGELGHGPFLYRYRDDDGVGGAEGVFMLCGFWLAETLALGGELETAQEVFSAHVDASNHLGLLAEELDPDSRELLGNFPQAFSHLGLINAACRIDLALRLRDEGSEKVPRLLLD
ncbi:MAG: glycoside hydrolase family 15 protein [Proteobacteria bacterium]|nr:glycoside hydrolase family 15 protein [Pseudomonadota bacterium]